jgi:hypothetical protein
MSTGKNDYTYLRKNQVCSLVKDKIKQKWGFQANIICDL